MAFNWKHHVLALTIGIGGVMALPQLAGFVQLGIVLALTYIVIDLLRRIYEDVIPMVTGDGDEE